MIRSVQFKNTKLYNLVEAVSQTSAGRQRWALTEICRDDQRRRPALCSSSRPCWRLELGWVSARCALRDIDAHCEVAEAQRNTISQAITCSCTPKVISDDIGQWRTRLQTCMKAKRLHFEHLYTKPTLFKATNNLEKHARVVLQIDVLVHWTLS